MSNSHLKAASYSQSRLLLMCIFMFSNFIVYSFRIVVAVGNETDKNSLLAIKAQLVVGGGGVPGVLSSWNHSLHFCRWQGVGCSHGRVTGLKLNNLELSGSISPSIGNLTFLREVTLSENSLLGTIPRELGRLQQLRLLNLTLNNLHGHIPVELANCSNLEVIILTKNSLSGYIPWQFGSMLQLTRLSLGGNGFSGAIPPSLVNLSSLNHLSLAFNHLQGEIPHDLGKISNLAYLFLSTNNLYGPLPQSIYNLTYMEIFDASVNNISGSLGSELGFPFPKLQQLVLAANELEGTIPSSIANMSSLQILDMFDNGLVGSVPNNLGKLKSLQELNIGLNNLGSGEAGDLDFLSSLSNCTQLNSRLAIHMNRFGGRIPDSISNFSIQLRQLYMGRNRISGPVPEGIGNLVGLTIIDMEINNLTGTIPSSFLKLKNLGRLFLNRNQLSGEIPPLIGNLSQIFDLYLHTNRFEGRIPSSLGDCKKLQNLLLSRNKLSGSIPNQVFGSLKSLVLLHSSENSLTGPLPPDLGELKNLNTLFIHENQLSGDIPVELGECSSLSTLSLASNLFQGSIPASFGSLRALDYLDLADNNLSGVIPRELEKLPFLKYLNLSFNYHLEGEVPKEGVFKNATALSITGDNNLCGGSPEIRLPKCPVPKHGPSTSLSTQEIVSLVVAIVLALLLLLLGALFCIYRKKRETRGKAPVAASLGDGYSRVSYKELLDATGGFSSSNLVGEGSFGSVYKGFLVGQETPVAVKVLDLKNNRGAAKSFVAECNALSKVRHRNLVKIVTCCSTVDYKGNDFKALVFEFMPNGSLDSWLHDLGAGSEPKNLNFFTRLTIALDVAYALEYLHLHCETPVVHCDLKPTNVLIDEEMVAHVGDFGLAKLVFGQADQRLEYQTGSSAVKGTIGYMAPELGMGGHISAEADIYSYGVLLLEMITGKRPTDNKALEEDDGRSTLISLHDFVQASLPEHVKEVTDSRLLEEINEINIHSLRKPKKKNVEQCLVSFASVGVACSSQVPGQRMKITDAIRELVAIKSMFLGMHGHIC